MVRYSIGARDERRCLNVFDKATGEGAILYAPDMPTLEPVALRVHHMVKAGADYASVINEIEIMTGTTKQAAAA